MKKVELPEWMKKLMRKVYAHRGLAALYAIGFLIIMESMYWPEAVWNTFTSVLAALMGCWFGHKDGYNKGREEGFKKGFEEGYRQGFNNFC